MTARKPLKKRLKLLALEAEGNDERGKGKGKAISSDNSLVDFNSSTKSVGSSTIKSVGSSTVKSIGTATVKSVGSTTKSVGSSTRSLGGSRKRRSRLLEGMEEKTDSKRILLDSIDSSPAKKEDAGEEVKSKKVISSLHTAEWGIYCFPPTTALSALL